MQLDYNQSARENNVYVVGACGFDSIPADMGTIFLEDKFDGEVNSVETFLRIYPKVKFVIISRMISLFLTICCIGFPRALRDLAIGHIRIRLRQGTETASSTAFP